MQLMETARTVMADFETVQEYAFRKIQSFSDSQGLHNIVEIMPDLNLNRLRSIAEFEVAWSRVLRLIKQHPNVERYNLPIGHPEGLSAFGSNTSHLKRNRREFMPQKIFPEEYVGAAGTWAILTIDERSNGRHVCITRRGGRPGIVAARALERLANNLYQELNIYSDRANSTQIHKNVFHFYEHTPAILNDGIRESFAKITMTFEDGFFRNPLWHHYTLLPLKIQPARIGLELIQAMTIAELCRQ